MSTVPAILIFANGFCAGGMMMNALRQRRAIWVVLAAINLASASLLIWKAA